MPNPNEHLGECYKINDYKLPEGVHRYYESVLDPLSGRAKWQGRDTVDMRWEPITWFVEKRKIDQDVANADTLDELENKFSTTDKYGKERILKQRILWANCGGYIRDDYIGKNIGGEAFFQNRGLPVDVSPEIKKDIESDYHYGETYVLLSEWEALLNAEWEKFVNKVKERFKDEKIEDILLKISDLFKLNAEMAKCLQRIESKSEAEPTPIAIRKRRKSSKNKYDDYYEDSLDYLFDEEIHRIFQIREEIDRCDFIVNELGESFADSKKIRIIYYLA